MFLHFRLRHSQTHVLMTNASVLETTSTSRSKTFCEICLRSVFYILFKLQEALQAMFKIILFHARDLYLDVVIFPRQPPENLYKKYLKLF